MRCGVGMLEAESISFWWGGWLVSRSIIQKNERGGREGERKEGQKNKKDKPH